jgi:hypothetical protein
MGLVIRQEGGEIPSGLSFSSGPHSVEIYIRTKAYIRRLRFRWLACDSFPCSTYYSKEALPQ